MTTKKLSSKENNAMSIEEQYKSMTQEEHILKLSDTYIGSKEADNKLMAIYDDNENRICFKEKTIIMGLYKIFDEILVNAADNTVKDKKTPTLNESNETIMIENINQAAS